VLYVASKAKVSVGNTPSAATTGGLVACWRLCARALTRVCPLPSIAPC
jgi:hypothetical protein